ncbi:MAG: dihydroorotate dehydrogenase (quinone) [Acidobacteria bacterium]|nr:MAG: dihydroorotate dehydrogenase (quinone) [Acidobacteriota bacterium]
MVYRSLLRPLLFNLPPETAHHLALKSLSLARPFIGRSLAPDKSTAIKLFGLAFPNPIGLAAGFDKNGVALQELASLGFGHIEAGTVTFHAQPGNPKPRLFRLPQDQALINRAGFNNEGAAAFAQRVRTARPDCVLGVSIGKSKITPLENAIDDYLGSFDLVYEVADYIAVNVSSPNTPQLRELQQADQLTSLVRALKTRNRELQLRINRSAPVPMLVKLSPDLSTSELEMIVDVVGKENVDGIIATNTTTSRDNLNSAKQKVAACGEGGLSGLPLRSRSTDIVARIYRLTDGRIPIIGVGGIFTAEDAWEKICAGASLVQLYTGFIYEGPFVARKINRGLVEIMKREGVSHLQEVIGMKANR